jgi:hypothetical protein
MVAVKPASSQPALPRKSVKSEDVSHVKRTVEREQQVTLRRIAAVQARGQSDQL